MMNTSESDQQIEIPWTPSQDQGFEPSPAQELKPVVPDILRDRGDLVARHFRAQHRRPVALFNIDVGDLLPYQRALLVCDGTVTSTIEALSLEPVTVGLHEESIVSASPEYACLLAVSPATTVVRRRVIIRGAESSQVYVYAESILLPDRLPAEFLSTVREDPRGLGSALRRSMVSSRRELLWFGGIANFDWPDYSSRPRPSTSRTYQIVVDENPAIVISEHFAW